MGWFWGASDSDDGKKPQDPLRGLDPSLRDFLTKESPVKYSSANPPSTPQSPTTSQPKQAVKSENVPFNSIPAASETTENKSEPPTLFKDGRYAHLWKTYQSQTEIEAAGKSDQEKITDVLEGYNYRKAEIGRAALENCALEQCDVNECFRSGGWASRLTMCRAENRKFERCYMMQSKFLKALGYLSTLDRSQEVDEQIQMHADTLYHRMLDQEKQIEAAKELGSPIPTFPPLLSTRTANGAIFPSTAKTQSSLDDNKIKASDLPPKVQAGLKKRLEGLNDEEREVEERAIKAEIQAGEQVAERLTKLYETQDEERQKRKEQGKETIGDRITSIFKFR